MAIQRRPWLIGFTTLTFMLFAAVLVALCPKRYTAFAEAVPDPAWGVRDPECALAQAEAWLRLPETALGVARSIDHAMAIRLLEPDANPFVIGRRRVSALPPAGSRAADAVLARQLGTHLITGRISQSYSLKVGYSANEPRLAAALANAFATRLVGGPGSTAASTFGMRIVSEADPDAATSRPAPWLILAIAALSGLVIGVMAAVVAERRVRGFSSGADIKAGLNLYHLGSVPLLASVLPNHVSPSNAIVEAPRSGFAEAFRGVLVAAKQASEQDAKVYGITSALPGEGKTTITICLARSAALAGERTLLVDCDSRRHGATTALAGVMNGSGLVGFLQGACTLDDALVQDEPSGAWLLPCSDETVDLSPFLSSGQFAAAVETLRTRFDRIFVDTAPVLAIATTRSILPIMDAAIMVVRWRSTPVQAVKAAIDLIPGEATSWAGVVLTQIDMRKQALHGQGDASAYYQQSSLYYQ